MSQRIRTYCLLLVCLLVAFPLPASETATPPHRQLVATEGKGYLERVDGYPVLHLKGTPREMGFQHGRLLKDEIRANLACVLDDAKAPLEVAGIRIPKSGIGVVLNMAFQDKLPERFVEEMRGLAEGADQPYWRVQAANLIPEAFHCSGFALLKGATADGKLYHGRVLDYGVGMGLQDHAVLILQEGDGRIAFANVAYAGFIGSVTGMNARGVSIGEMGGGGTGRWKGVPMSFLVRMVLEQAAGLDQAVAVFRDNPRTCEYYYVIADAGGDKAVGMKATPAAVEVVQAGQAHPLLPNPVENTVILSAGSRYRELAKRISEAKGTFTAESAIRLMDGPVAMRSNLHDALMVPGDGVLYVANASSDGKPAWKQKYYRFDTRELMKTKP